MQNLQGYGKPHPCKSQLVQSTISNRKSAMNLQVFPLRGEHQFAVFDPAQAQNPVGEMAYLRTPPSHDDHFQAIVVIQVNVRGGKHLPFGVVLRLDQPLRKSWAVVVVNQGQGPYHRAVFFHIFGHSVVPDKVTNGF